MIKPTLYHKGDQNLVYSVQKETLEDKEIFFLFILILRFILSLLK